MLPPLLEPRLFSVHVGFSLVFAGHNFFLRGNCTVPPTDLQNLGRSGRRAFGRADQLGEDEVADAPGGKPVCHLLDSIVHQFRVTCSAGRRRKTICASPCLNALVFGINLDSVLNDIGMLLACGVVKKITCESVQSIFSTASAHKVEPAAPPVFDSEAYNKPDSESSD